MKKKLMIGGALAAMLVAGGIAIAQHAPGGPRGGAMMLKLADANGDGVVTKAEFTAALDQRFAKMDGNKDGKVTVEERQALGQQRIAERFGRIDADKNGQISKAEFTAAATQPHDDGHPPMGPMGGRRGGWMAGMGKDGPLTKTDFVARPLALFDRIDANHDGRLTAEEMQAARRMMGMGMHGDMPPHAQPRP